VSPSVSTESKNAHKLASSEGLYYGDTFVLRIRFYICCPGGGAAAVPVVALVWDRKSAGLQSCHIGTAGPDDGSRTSCTVAQHERGPGDGDRR
jgi:hypothetical protein